MILLVAGNGSAGATAVAAADTLTLVDVITLVAERSPTLKLGDAAIARAYSRREMASDHLDPSLRLEASGGMSRVGNQPSSVSPWGQSYRASMVQGTNWGISVAPYVSVAPVAGGSGSTASYGLSVAVPVLHLGSRSQAGAMRRAASIGVRAAQNERKHIIASEMLSAALAFFDVLAAQQRRDVVTDARNRAGEVLRAVSRLVEVGERAEAERAQAEAFAADRATEQLAAEQGVWASAAQLAVLAGVPVDRFVEMPLQADEDADFNPLRAKSAVDVVAHPLVRPDLEASRLTLEAERIVARAQDLNVLPQLVVTGSFGREAATLAPTVIDQRFASVSLVLEGTLQRRRARGEAAEYRVRVAELAVAQERAELAAEAGRRVALRISVQSANELKSARRALIAHRRAVENERSRLASGFATVLDVIQAEDRLTGARLAVIAARLRLGQAMARLAYERGQIVVDELDTPDEWASRLLSGGGAQWR